MNRFFVDRERIVDNEIVIDGEDFNHIKNVLRLKEGQDLEVVSEGRVYLSRIASIGKKKLELLVLENKEGDHEAPLDLYLYQGLAKGKKMDFIIQKATELGVKKLIPLETQRAVVKIDEKKEDKKIERWNQIALEASKQSKRDLPMEVEDVRTISSLKDSLKGEFILIPYELESTRAMKEVLCKYENQGPIHIIIGPEGGFTEEEIELVESMGGYPVSLGPRILRTETAGIVAASVVLYELGDIGVR